MALPNPSFARVSQSLSCRPQDQNEVIPGHHLGPHEKRITLPRVEPEGLHFNQPHRHNSQQASHKPSRTPPLKTGSPNVLLSVSRNFCHLPAGVTCSRGSWSLQRHCMTTFSNTAWPPARLSQGSRLSPFALNAHPEQSFSSTST